MVWYGWLAGGSCTQVGDSLAFTTDKLAFLGRHSEASSASEWPNRFIDARLLLYIRLSRAFIKIWSWLLVGGKRRVHDLTRHAFGFTKAGFVVPLSVHRWNGLCYLAFLGFTRRREDDAYIKGDGKEGRKEGRKGGREGRKEGRKEGREEGREEGRKEGRKEGLLVLRLGWDAAYGDRTHWLTTHGSSTLRTF